MNDGLDPACGILTAMLAGTAMWAVVAILWWAWAS